MHERRAQLDLHLEKHRSWGGRRAGAGRKPGPQPRVRHRRREGIRARFPAHVTVKLRRGLPSSRSVRVVRALERTFAEACDRGDFRVVHYTLQSVGTMVRRLATEPAQRTSG
jgi:hypothetical protein